MSTIKDQVTIPIDVPYVGVWEIEGHKIKAQRIYYDRMELLTQLGLTPGPSS